MNDDDIHEPAMRAAIEQARRALAAGEMPYGAIVAAADGTMVAGTHDRIEGCNDPTRHAEFDAVRLAIDRRGPDLRDCLLVSTVEPCCMCSGAAWYAGIKTAVFGLGMHELKRLCPSALEEALGPVAEIYQGMHRQMTAVQGVLRDECLALWKPYTDPMKTARQRE